MPWVNVPLDDVLDLIHFGEQLSPEAALAHWEKTVRRPVHPGHVRWTAHAVRSYLKAVAEVPAAPGVPEGGLLEPVSRRWARQRGPRKAGDPAVYEELVDGRRYAGYGVRELHIVRTRSVRDLPRDKAEIAVAVGVLAGGRPVFSSKWGKRKLELGRFEQPRLVRLVEIGLLDASHNVLFEGTPEEAYAEYDASVEESVGELIAGGDYRPGENCGRCNAVATCPAVPSRPGFLGVSGAGLPRRSWSVTTGRTYRRCPARSHFENLFLPRDRSAEDSDAVVRGNAVHAWLESRHRRTPVQPCDVGDVPTGSLRHREREVTGLQARLGIQMIGDHSLVCPVKDGSQDTEVHPERPVVVYDPEADVVVVAKTDLLYRVGDRWTLRETKTTMALSEGDLLEKYPQLALAVLFVRDGVLPGAGQCRVELERLTGNGPVLTGLDAHAPDVIAQAERVVERYVSKWHTDTGLRTDPGKACQDCPFTRWCPDAKKETGA